MFLPVCPPLRVEVPSLEISHTVYDQISCQMSGLSGLSGFAPNGKQEEDILSSGEQFTDFMETEEGQKSGRGSRAIGRKVARNVSSPRFSGIARIPKKNPPFRAGGGVYD
jgi:hypothetical protein